MVERVRAFALTAEELRVLACLIEKAHTTPDQYPLSTNGLVSACNQKTSRDPVVDFSASLIDQTMLLLRDGGWARTVMASGSRVAKHRHIVDERLGLNGPQLAVVAVLALRGPQSAGELKTRTERYYSFSSPGEVEVVLEKLAASEPPLTRNVGRGPGQSHDRWVQLLGPTSDEPPQGDRDQNTNGPSRPTAPDVPVGAVVEMPALQQRVEALERRLDALEQELGFES